MTQEGTPPSPDRDDAQRVRIFDTTLRDGEQSPGIHLNTREKLEIAHQLAGSGVDVIEAGFPITSPGDFEAVQAIAREVPDLVVAALARAKDSDVTTAGEAVRDAERPRIHTFIATSDIHLTHKLRMDRAQVLAAAVDSVRLARSLVRRRGVLVRGRHPVRPGLRGRGGQRRPSPRARPRSTSRTRSATRCRPSSSAS